ncbi:MAG: PspC domain-containing protein [Ignavibacteria bacterium]|nr:MAG: PspC domain-containing protein [Ignavibacteria bacterium]
MKRVYRSREDQKIAGVVGGLAEYLNVDANLLRLAVVLLCFLTGIIPVVITYLLAWLIIPEEGE